MGNRTKFLLFFLLFAFFVTPSSVVAATYYVSPSGSDTAAGTQTTPWQTIQKAVNTVDAGDTIFIREGTYNESVKVTKSGTAASPIKLTNYNNETVIIDSGANKALEVKSTSTQYWIVENLRFISTATETVHFNAWGCDGACNGIDHWIFRNNYIQGAVQLYGAYNVIEGNEVDGRLNNGNNGNGIQDRFPVSHHNIFRNNRVHDFSSRAIWTMNRTHDNLIEGNTVYNIGNQCINTDGYATVEYRHTIKNNLIYNCGSGIEMENTFDSLVENNVIHDTTELGIDVINYGPDIPAPGNFKCQIGGENNQYGDTDGDNSCQGSLTNNILKNNLIYNAGLKGGIVSYFAGGIKILNNTVYGGQKWGLGLYCGLTPVNYCPQIQLQSNIFAQNGTAEISAHRDFSSFTVDSNNVFHNPNPNTIYERRIDWKYFSLPSYKTLTGKGQNSLLADPLFVNLANKDFHLQPNSPACGLGAFPCTASSSKPADANGDSKVDGIDYVIWLNHYNQSVSGPANGDFNTSGKVDGVDYVIWVNNYGT